MGNVACLLFGGLAIVSAALGLFPAAVEKTRALPSRPTVIRDMYDREISFDRPPENVVLPSPLIASFATVDGTPQHIAGMPDFVRAQVKDGLLSHVFPQMDLIPLSGRTGMPDVEWILRRQPDAVVAWSSNSEVLEKTGFLGLIEIDFTLANYKDARLAMWRLVGAITGRSDRARELLDRFHDNMKELLGQLYKVKDEPTRFIIPFDMGGGHWTVATNYYLNETFETSGGINIARDMPFHDNMDFEQIYRFDPEIILLRYDEHGPVPQRLYDDPRWRPVRAVRNRRVYLMPMTFLDNIAVDEPLLLRWLAEIFHPDALPRMTRAAYRDTYAQIYNYDLTDDEIDQALFMKENCASEGYERFSRDQERCHAM